MPWRALAAPLAQAEDALARLDERLRTSPVREGWISRTHFTEGCAALWLEGELVHLEDLVLHDAGMDVSAPTHALIRAHAVLRARRRIAAEPADWALSGAGLAALRGDAAGGAGPEQGRGRTAQSDATGGGAQGDDSDGDGFDNGPIGDDGERAVGRSRFRICGGRRFDRAVAPRHRRRSGGAAAARFARLRSRLERGRAPASVAGRARSNPDPAAAARRRVSVGGLGADRTAAASPLARRSSRRRGVARAQENQDPFALPERRPAPRRPRTPARRKSHGAAGRLGRGGRRRRPRRA